MYFFCSFLTALSINLHSWYPAESKFLNSASYVPGKIHTVWVKCKHNSNSLLKAYVQVKLSCGSYILQSVRARFNQFQVSKLCPLCQEADETLQHFILHCGVLEQTRHSFINELVGSVNNEKLLGLILDLRRLVCMKRTMTVTGKHVYFRLHEDFVMLCMCREIPCLLAYR